MTNQTASSTPSIQLNDGTSIPQLGYGVFQVDPAETARLVKIAIASGYRSIDTAHIYRNEDGVGDAIREAGVPREELYITTKLWNDSHTDARAAFDQSMELLGLDVLDLYLIHWPSPKHGNYVDAWRSLVELQAEGRIRSIGVSNFAIEHLEAIIEATGVKPVLNQIELHPYFPQTELRAWCAEHGIAVESWSPIGQGGGLLDEPVLAEIAEATSKSPAQVVIRWHIQHGLVVIPKSAHDARIAENIDVFDFELSAEQMQQIDGLDRGPDGRRGPDPVTADF